MTATATDGKPDRLVYEQKAASPPAVPLSKRRKPQAVAPAPKKERQYWGSHRYALDGHRNPRPYLNCDGVGRHGPESICGCGSAACRHGYADVERGVSGIGVDCAMAIFGERVEWIKENFGFDPISGRSNETHAEVMRESLYRAAHAEGVIGRQGS